jgi:hypothetical protein
VRLAYNLLERRVGKYTVRIGLYLGSWIIGGYFDGRTFGSEVGPLAIDWEDSIPTEAVGRRYRSRRIFRLPIQPLKIVIRFKLNLRIWRVGYLMSAPYDHCFFLGPFNLQVECGVSYTER